MKKLFSFLTAILFAASMMAADPVEIVSGTFNGKGGTYTEGWSTTGTGVSRTDCVIVGSGENITSPSVDLSQYESISIAIKARRYGTLSGSKATIAVTFDGEAIGSTEASGTSATTSLTAIEYTVDEGLSTGTFVFTCSNATSAGSTHGAGINSIVITGVKKASQGGETSSTIKTLYCKAAQDWWKADNAATGIYAYAAGGIENAAWPGVRMTPVEGETDLWEAEIDTAKYDAIIFTRMNPSNEGNQDYGAKTGDLTIPADKDLYTITSTSAVWGDPGVTGTWSVYTAQGGEVTPVTPAEKDFIYFVNVAGWAAPRVHLWDGTAAGTEWPGVEMTKLDDKINNYDVYKYVADKGAYAKCIFSDNGANQTADLTWTSGKYFYNDAWYALSEIPGPVVPAKFYITGDSALVVDAGLDKAKAWAPNAIKSETDTLVLSLKAGVDYQLSLTVDGTWNTKKTYTDLTQEDKTGLQDLDGDNHNIGFKLAEAGQVKVVYFVKDEVVTFKLIGNFFVPETVWAISGAWNNFGKDLFVVAEDKKTASFAIDLEAGEYEFKIRKDDAWLTKANEGSAYGLHREWTGVAGVTDEANENIKLTADENGVYTFVWTFANDSIGVNFPAKHALNEVWKVTGETAVAAETKYVDNYALTVNTVYAGTLKDNARQFGGYAFTHAIQIRNAAYPSAENVNGTEQSGSTSLVITAKEDVEVTFFYNRQTGNEAENDGKDMIVYDQADLSKLTGAFAMVPTTAEGYFNATKTLALTKGHVYTVSAKGTTIQLSGIRYISDAVAPVIKYYIAGEGEGLDWTDKIAAKQDTTILNLKAGDYKLKVVAGDQWLGFEALTDTAAGLKELDGDNHNIGFTLNEDAAVTVVYNDSVFRLIGNFYIAPIKYYLAGTMTNWKADSIELVALEDKADSLGATVALKADSLYEYKVVRIQGKDTAWYGMQEFAAMAYGNSEGWWIYPSEGENNQANVGLQTTDSANYAFVVNVAEDHLAVSVVIPAHYYAKYQLSEDGSNWGWKQLTKKDALYMTDTIVYRGSGMNIDNAMSEEPVLYYSHDKANTDVRHFAGDSVVALDTVVFAFNPADSTLTAQLVGRYVAPAVHYYLAGTMTNWKADSIELVALEDKVDSLGVTIALKADSLYEYKVVRIQGKDTAWYGMQEFAAMTYGNSEGWWIYLSVGENNQANVGLQTTDSANYAFVVNVAEDHLAVSVAIPARYYAKYQLSEDGSDWGWKQLTKKDALYMTDTIVYRGSGMNIDNAMSEEPVLYYSHDKANTDVRHFAGDSVVALDTVVFAFNPADSTLTAQLVGRYVAPAVHYYLAGTMTNWKADSIELVALEDKVDSLGVTIALKADSLYEYKVVRIQGKDTAWYGIQMNEGEEWAPMTYGNSNGWWIKAGNDYANVGLQTTKEADYTFVLQPAEDHLVVSVIIPEPDKHYFAKAKWAADAEDWAWIELEKNEAGLFSTDEVVYYGGGMNINSAADDALALYYSEAADAERPFAAYEGFAALDTVVFAFNPADSVLTVTLVGKYVEPAPVLPVMQIAGAWNVENDAWVRNDMTVAADELTATYTVELAKGYYEFKLIKDGAWISKANGGSAYGLHRDWKGVAGVTDIDSDNLQLHADVAGTYTFTWTFANDSIGITFPDKPDMPELNDGYYIIGLNGWDVTDLTADDMFWSTGIETGEFSLSVTLAAGDQFKVVWVEDDEIKTWFPEGSDNDYFVDANHAGATTVYFRPNYDGNADWHEACIYVVPTTTVGVEAVEANAPAVKVLRDGRVIIIRGENVFNTIGQKLQ